MNQVTADGFQGADGTMLQIGWSQVMSGALHVTARCDIQRIGFEASYAPGPDVTGSGAFR